MCQFSPRVGNKLISRSEWEQKFQVAFLCCLSQALLAETLLNSHQDRQMIHSTQCKEVYKLLCLPRLHASNEPRQDGQLAIWKPYKWYLCIIITTDGLIALPISRTSCHILSPHPDTLCVIDRLNYNASASS